MRSLGISISHDRLSAVIWEKTPFSARPICCCSVPCREPFGGAEDAAALASALRKESGGAGLPPAALSLPPSWTFLREIELPVHDLPRAKAIHLSEIEGTLPFEDEEIVSDIFPSPPGRPGRFFAAAARRPTVEKAVSALSAAGFRIDRIVPDVASIFAAALSLGFSADGVVLAALPDLVAVRIEGGTLARARQVPVSAAGALPDVLEELSGPAEGGDATAPHVHVAVIGEASAAAPLLPADAARIALPGAAAPASPAALGAALLPWVSKETGDFSLKIAAVSESALSRERTRTRIAAASAAVALIAVSVAIWTAGWAQSRIAERAQSQLRKELSEIFPGIRPTAVPAAQLRERTALLQRQQKETDADAIPLSDHLRRVSGALPAQGRISVTEIALDGGKLRVAGEADNSRSAESFRSALAAAYGAGFSVTLESSQGRAGRGTVAWSILVERKEPPRAS